MNIQQELQNILKKKGFRNYSKGLNERDDLKKILREQFGDLDVPQLFYLGLNPHIDYICACGNIKSFKTLQDGFRTFCSSTCPNKKKLQSQKISEKWRNRTEQEVVKIFEKVKKTNLERYGRDNPAKNKDVRQKTEQTNLKRYGSKTPFESNIIQNKIKSNNIKKYGVEYPFQNKEILNQSLRNQEKKYGGLMVNARKVLNGLYPNNPFSDENIKQQIKETNIEKYGVEYPIQNDTIQKKRIETYQLRYGRDNSSQSHIPLEILAILNDCNKLNELYKKYNIFSLAEFLNVDQKTISRYMKKSGIELPGRSSYENQYKTLFNSLGLNYKQNISNIINGELDFYFPEHYMAIEICGLYYHSQFSKYGKTNNLYHYNKWKQCSDKNIQLLTIFEDEILKNPQLVQNMIFYKLGLCDMKSIGARNINIKKIDANLAIRFLDKNHIQGGIGSSICYGGFYYEDLISVMLFKPNPRGKYDYELLRFSTTNGVYPGLASKMLKYFINEFNVMSIVSFSDNRWSNGGLYKKIGFCYDGDVKPDYYYTDYSDRYHKSNFRKQRLNTDSSCDQKTEKQIVLEMGYDRIWDCGKKRFVWKRI